MPVPGDADAVDYGRLIEDRRVHGSLYTDRQVFVDEIDRIFRRGWIFVGHESEIPKIGDWVTRRLGREPVIHAARRRGRRRPCNRQPLRPPRHAAVLAGPRQRTQKLPM